MDHGLSGICTGRARQPSYSLGRRLCPDRSVMTGRTVATEAPVPAHPPLNESHLLLLPRSPGNDRETLSRDRILLGRKAGLPAGTVPTNNPVRSVIIEVSSFGCRRHRLPNSRPVLIICTGSPRHFQRRAWEL